MANTKLLEQEVRNLAEAKGRRVDPALRPHLPDPARNARAAAGDRRGGGRSRSKTGKLVRCVATAFAPSSIDCELVYDDRTIDPDTLAAHKSAIIIGVARAFASEGIDFAYPTQTTFTAAPDGTLVMPWAPPAAANKLAVASPAGACQRRSAGLGRAADAHRLPRRNPRPNRQRSASPTGSTVDQDRIDAFADATDDHQFIHVDPAAAAQTPFGGTIAHGFLTLSLLSPHGGRRRCWSRIRAKMAVNYGLDRVRFLAPVRVRQARARPLHARLRSTKRRPANCCCATVVTVEIEGEEKPALTAQMARPASSA